MTISERESTLVDLYAYLSASLCIVRADWNRKKRLLVFNPSLRKLLGNVLFFSVCSALFIHSGFRLRKIYVSSANVDATSQVEHFMYILLAIIYGGASPVLMYLACCSQSFVELFNHLIVFSAKPCFRVLRDGYFYHLQLAFFGIICVLAVTLVSIEAHFAWIQTHNLWLTVFVGIVLFSLSLMFGVDFGFMQSYLYLYFTTVKQDLSICEELPKQKTEEQESNPEVSDEGYAVVNSTCQKYRSLAILTNEFNLVFGRFLLPVIKYVVIFSGLANMLITVRLGKSRQPGSTLVTLIFLSFTFHAYFIVIIGSNVMASICKRSTAFLEHFRKVDANDDQGLRKYKGVVGLSLRPFKIGIGGFYYVDKATNLKLAGFLIIATAKLLVAFG